jgi:3-oxoacid CoA-transferase A subunit
LIDKAVSSLEQALAGLDDGASIMVSGFGGSGVPVALIKALEASGVGNLTLVLNTPRFVDGYAPKLFGEMRVKKLICSAARGRGKTPSIFEQQWHAGELEVELVPQGTFSERVRAGGAGIPAFYSPAGVDTRLAEGKERRRFDGRDYVLESAINADFAFIRADVSDRLGNLRFKGTQANFGTDMAAAAAVTVVEVNRVVDAPLQLRDIDLPGIYVQRVFECEDLR